MSGGSLKYAQEQIEAIAEAIRRAKHFLPSKALPP
jgi:ribosomal protein L16/L10AE